MLKGKHPGRTSKGYHIDPQEHIGKTDQQLRSKYAKRMDRGLPKLRSRYGS